MKPNFSSKFTILVAVIQLFALNVFGQDNIDISAKKLKGKVGINNKFEGYISLEDILNSPKLSFIDTNDTKYKIIGFRMTLIAPGLDSIELENIQNGDLTESMIRAIRKHSFKAHLFFDNIKCVDEKQILYDIDDIDLRIK